MQLKLVSRMLGACIALTLVASGCSGGDDGDTTVGDPEANAPIEQIDAGSGGVAAGPIVGLLTVQPSFGFGLFDVDPATGQAAAVPGVAAVETVDRNDDVIVSNGRAFAIGGATREGQTFASDISVVRVDYATGEVVQLAPLGFDRETDDSETSIAFSLVAVAGDSVVVRAKAFGSDDPAVFTVYDADSGQQKSTFTDPQYSFESDTGTCNGGIQDFVGLSDGRMAGVALGSPAVVDLDNGEIELLINCDQPDPELDDFVTPAQVADYAVFNEGPAMTEEQIIRLLDTDIEPRWGFVEGGGDLWWIDSDSRTVDESKAIVGGVVQFDLATGSVEAVHSLGEHLGEYIDCGPDSDGCSTTSLEQAELRYSNDRLVMVDIRENGRILVLDPATGAITVTELERGEGVDYTDAELLVGDPNNVWLEVKRMTVTKDDDTGRTATGPVYIERFDAVTGTINFSAPGQNLFN